jgi:L-threonylcarbamoyladenylate synthase
MVERAIAGLSEGRAVILPTDTVYGLAGNPEREDWALAALAVKGREDGRPTALLAGSIDALLDRLPELRGSGETVLRALLPGPYTLVLANPAQRYPWLCGGRPDAIGVRVPNLPKVSQLVLDAVGLVFATSANDPGGPDPATLADVPRHIRDGCAAELDVGLLPGSPSTVLDLSTPEPRVLRAGAIPAEEALAQVRAALGQ